MLTFHIITIFPSMFDSYFGESILARAIKDKKIAVKLYNPRDFTKDKHRRIDDKPYGGGPGMVMQAEPILKTVTSIKKKVARKKKSKIKTLITAAGGKKFTNALATKYTTYTDIIIICGRYEGIDTRVRKALRAEEVSIGDYILTGGELPAMVMVDTISRHIDGVLGKSESIEENRTASHEMYTRPELITVDGKNYKVPKVLLSGDHKKIEEWRGK